jgi:uncharacterized protein
MDEASLINPCISCGACCAQFRVSFYWAEASDTAGDGVPAELTEQITPHLRAMRGTLATPVRCVALDGTVGQQVGCRIYAQRPSTCREFSAWDADGQPSPQCSRARQRIGLPPLPAVAASATPTPDR